MDRLEAVKGLTESLSAHELADFRESFESYDGDLATAERRYAALKAGQSVIYSLDEVERFLAEEEGTHET